MDIETATTNAPQQGRSKLTYEKLMRSTGLLLARDGIEKISTNAIVKHAELTPLAFYRYFSSKYDILEALTRRLMDEQNQIIVDMVAGERQAAPPNFSTEQIEYLIFRTIKVTEAFTGGPWVMRSLRAVPALDKVRLESHDKMASLLADDVVTLFPELVYDVIYRQTRLAIDIGYAMIELAFDEPDLDRQALVKDTANAITSFAAW
ncbi:TetR/AcrR family transcriptional regulator [Parasphingorhabdus sp.]|uniref:TetR/AcrR family transcriptional regulator n=1 Tax=Parasphingorhabdus sp. TaxID=2709688 RepID=UPI00326494A2